jgi:two-component system chemotaxis sensor kinase CheA
MDNKDREFLQRIQATFRIEAEEHLKAFSVQMNELEKVGTPEGRAGIIETMFREVHSLKGAARSVGRKEIESVCQPLESLFSLLKRQMLELTPAMTDIFYTASDFLLKLILKEGEGQLQVEKPHLKSLIQQIEMFVPGTQNAVISDEQTKPVTLNQVEELRDLSTVMIDVEDVLKNTRPSGSEAVRIPISKLNPLLLQAEEFIQSKIAFHQLAKEVKVILKEINDWKSESLKTKGRKMIPGVGQWNDLLTGNELRLSNLESHLAKVTQAMEKEGFAFERMVDDHLDAMKHILLLPVSTLTQSFPAMVREISHNLRKEIDFTITGSELEIDKRILEELKDPIIHLIRNSIDHGIESPEDRKLLDKPTRGSISLSFVAKESGMVEMSVTDDGRGIEEEKVLKAAFRSGKLTREDAEKLNREEILSFIYQSGLSTSSIITDLSGHGLGLSILREKVEKLNGSLSMDTEVNRGTIFRIVLPMTLSTFRGIMVRVGEFTYIIPTSNVKMAVRVLEDEINTVENHETIRIGDDILPLLSLADVLGIPEKGNNNSGEGSGEPIGPEYLRIVVLAYAEKRLAFRVDDVLEEQHVLVKGLGKMLNKVRNISGATILGSGKIVPVLNIADLMKSGSMVSGIKKARVYEEPVMIKARKILIAEDSITSRTLLKSILESAGYQVTTAVDGLDAFTKARSQDFDLLVSDVDMPRMNGFELTTKIKNDNKLNEIPVILVTALESREDREKGIEVGADAYIVKSSFDQENLLEVIKKLI